METNQAARFYWCLMEASHGWHPALYRYAGHAQNVFGGNSVKLILLVICVSIAGCIPYPTYKTLQPYAKAHVTDQSGRPVSGVKVSLISSAYPYGFERFRAVRLPGVESQSFSRLKSFALKLLGCMVRNFISGTGALKKTRAKRIQHIMLFLLSSIRIPCLSLGLGLPLHAVLNPLERCFYQVQEPSSGLP